MLAQSEVPLVPLGEHIYNKRPEVGKQTFFFKSANQKSANYKQTGSLNHKFATCKIYGRTANKTNYISPRICNLKNLFEDCPPLQASEVLPNLCLRYLNADLSIQTETERVMTFGVSLWIFLNISFIDIN
jgi:hypothetical protein